MNFFQRVSALFYVTFTMFLGVSILMFVMHRLDIEQLFDVLYMIYTDKNLRIGFGIGAGILLFFNYLFYQFFTVSIQRDKIIAFDNPSGRVSVSLVAIEDLIKRTILKLPEIKDVKTVIRASKRGLRVNVRLMLTSIGNIPEFTSHVQELVRKKIQDSIGIEETADITVHVSKILPEQVKDKRKEHVEEPIKEIPHIPFQGYRA